MFPKLCFKKSAIELQKLVSILSLTSCSFSTAFSIEKISLRSLRSLEVCPSLPNMFRVGTYSFAKYRQICLSDKCGKRGMHGHSSLSRVPITASRTSQLCTSKINNLIAQESCQQLDDVLSNISEQACAAIGTLKLYNTQCYVLLDVRKFIGAEEQKAK